MGAVMTDYDSIYRKMHPPMFPFSPYERRRELRDLWPAEQQKFKRMVDAVGDAERIFGRG